MKTTKRNLIIALVAALTAVLVYFIGKSINQTQTPAPNALNINTDKTYTLEEVNHHNTSKDCWTAIAGDVYDITDYIDQHPGGKEVILLTCGKDGTDLFTRRETSSGQKIGSGTGHSANAENIFIQYRIGSLVN